MNKAIITIGGIVAALSLSACASATESAEPAPTVTVTATPKVEDPAVVENDTYAPDLSDFEVTLKVLDKQCFGSAGCSVEVEAKVTADNDALAPDWLGLAGLLPCSCYLPATFPDTEPAPVPRLRRSGAGSCVRVGQMS